MRYRYSIFRYCIGLLLIIGLGVSPALAQEPGTGPESEGGEKAQVAAKSLDEVFATESGNISTSIDGVGTNDSAGTIQVDKSSSGATVRRAFFLAAAGSDFDTDGELDDITLSNGSNSETISPSDYESTVTGVFSGAEIGRVEVTSFVSSVVDPASAGMIDITVDESNPPDVEGSMLVVIFDDPSVSEPRSVSLVFGIQDADGDSFNIGLADPFDDASQDIRMSLGISFGFQGDFQASEVDVNGTRMTSSAGGQDDCPDLDTSDSDQECFNGELFTVGGIGDDPANPPDPNAGPNEDPRYDDELYTLDDFVNDGDTQIDVFSENPSFDDNVFFAAFIVKGGTAVVGEGITLAPSTATNPVGTDHTVTATVQDDDGNPIQGRDVDFEITSGPNSGLTGSDVTDSNGEATFTWSSSATGTDIAIAETVDSNGDPLVSNGAEKTWTTTATCDVPSLGADDIDKDNGTLENTISDDDGVEELTFSTLDGFEVGSISASNYDPSDSDGDGTPDTWTWDGTGSRATSIDFTLEATQSQATYFLEVTDACDDPEPNTTTFDPSYEMGPVTETAQLLGNAPNPFRGQTTVEFALPEQTRVTVAVYDMMGRKVATLVDGARRAGTHRVRWNGESDGGQSLSSGVYLMRMQAGGQSEARRVTIVR